MGIQTTKVPRKDDTPEAQTLEGIRAESELLKAQIELEVLKGERDKPAVLVKREAELNAKELELKEKDDLLGGKEQRLIDEVAAVAAREQAIGFRIMKFKGDRENVAAQIETDKSDVTEVVARLNRYIDFAKLSHYCDLEQRLTEDDVEKLQWALNKIKEWRKGK